MKIAVMSDSHDHLENIENAVELMNGAGADILIHCGDLCSPFVIDRLAAFKGQVHIVFGNNDGDRFTISRIADRFENVMIHGEFGTAETPSGMIAFTHRPEFGSGLAATGRYIAVFSGHTHRRAVQEARGSQHLNPGELMGLVEEPGFIIFETDSLSSRQFTLSGD